MRTDFFVPGDFRYRQVFVDHHCSKLPVAAVARAVDRIARSDLRGVIHVGRERETLYNVLRDEIEGIEGIRISESPMPDFPAHLSLDVGLYRERFADPDETDIDL